MTTAAAAAATSITLPPLPKITTRSGAAPSLLSIKAPNSSRFRSIRAKPRSLASNFRTIGSSNYGRGGGAVCYAGVALGSPSTLRWAAAASSGVLMLVKGTAIQKSFLVPLFALQAPAAVISWIKGEYGTWTAFLALLVRIFYFIPGELHLPFFTLLLVIVAPYQAMNLRTNQAGEIICLAISVHLAIQHFSRAGSLRRAFDQVSVIATLAIICIAAVSCLFLF